MASGGASDEVPIHTVDITNTVPATMFNVDLRKAVAQMSLRGQASQVSPDHQICVPIMPTYLCCCHQDSVTRMAKVLH